MSKPVSSILNLLGLDDILFQMATSCNSKHRHCPSGPSRYMQAYCGIRNVGYTVPANTRMWPLNSTMPLQAVCSHLVAWHPVNEISRGCPSQTHNLLKLVNILDAWSRALLNIQCRKKELSTQVLKKRKKG